MSIFYLYLIVAFTEDGLQTGHERRHAHHASIDHGCVLGQHSAPAVALNVNEAQQLGILDVLPRHVASVGRQVGRQGQTCNGVLCKLCTQGRPVQVTYKQKTMLC